MTHIQFCMSIFIIDNANMMDTMLKINLIMCSFEMKNVRFPGIVQAKIIMSVLCNYVPFRQIKRRTKCLAVKY